MKDYEALYIGENEGGWLLMYGADPRLTDIASVTSQVNQIPISPRTIEPNVFKTTMCITTFCCDLELLGGKSGVTKSGPMPDEN
ncbi:hypothetical protein N7499_009547 [Penicillium canescens]|nr:hypothetical protein N7499_009547 [Penicillium canescens]KAJ6170213.1 hypothetical protein N7485_007559 [Penicillium canescens]